MLKLEDVKTKEEYLIFACSREWNWVKLNSCYVFNFTEVKENIERHKMSMELSGCYVGTL
ncbi:MAG: hypothetical protein N3G19_00660 [Candidatus Pacearchaeota archaeon]|nr:hypothetical protein [Candidatus Pacearchaeota archaeon]